MQQSSFFKSVFLPAILPLTAIALLRWIDIPVPHKFASAVFLVGGITIYLIRLERHWGMALSVHEELHRFNRLIWLLLFIPFFTLTFYILIPRAPRSVLIWVLLFTSGPVLFILLTLFLQLKRLSTETAFRSFRFLFGMVIIVFVISAGWSAQLQFIIFFLLAIWLFRFENVMTIRMRQRLLISLFAFIGFILLQATVSSPGITIQESDLTIGRFTLTPRIVDSIRILKTSLIPWLPEATSGLQRLLSALLIVLTGKMLLRPFADWLKLALRIRTKMALSYILSSIIPALILVLIMCVGVLFLMGGFWQILIDEMIESRTSSLKSMWDSSVTFVGAERSILPVENRSDISNYLRKNGISAVFADVNPSNRIQNLRFGGAPIPDITSQDSLVIQLEQRYFSFFDDSLGVISIKMPSFQLPGVSLPTFLAEDSTLLKLAAENFDGLCWFDKTAYLTYWMRRGNTITGLFQPFTLEDLQEMKAQAGADLMIIQEKELRIDHLVGGGVNIQLGDSFEPLMRTTQESAIAGFDIPIHFPALYSSLAWEAETGFKEHFSVVIVQTSLRSVFGILFSMEHLINRVYLTIFAVLSAVFGIILILVALLGFGLAGGITRSIHRIRKGTQQLRKGDLTASIEVKSRDELGELAESFNLMVADLNRMLEEVKEKERLEGELEAAKAIQLRLLPRDIPHLEGFDIAAKSLPAKQVGGDYYDFLPLPHNHLGIAVGDVSGKGMPAALLMANLQACLRTLIQSEMPPEQLVERLNNVLHQNTSPQMFATFFYAAINAAGNIKYVNAGHNYPILCGNGRFTELKDGGMLLGVVPGGKYKAGQVELHSGEIIALYSDGITEALNGSDEEFGEKRLEDLLQGSCQSNAMTILEGVIQEVQKFCGTPQDDVTLMIVKRV
ncbi:MAG: SpoIIE family protein phosphatase [bacterium]|nr:SpoIIE family protein phosphatase [bacterium]